MNKAQTSLISEHVERVLVHRAQIAKRVDELAGQIARHYDGQEITILAVLTGSLIFLSDLIRRMPVLMRLNLISVCSYPGTATVSQGPRIEARLPADLATRHVLIIDDILDSGKTLDALSAMVRGHHPASLRTCVLLRKARTDLTSRHEPDFVGFEVANEFVVGYGLDYDNLYRNLPDISVLRSRHMGVQGGST
jgi:hypoxanthine phosphoribosyltransferase